MNNNKYRHYCDKNKDKNCKYMKLNKYGVSCCSLDNIVQIEYFGCIPQIVINKKKVESHTYGNTNFKNT